MKDNKLVFFNILSRGLGSLAAILGAAWLAYSNVDGWGWLLFVGFWLGAFTVSSNKKE